MMLAPELQTESIWVLGDLGGHLDALLEAQLPLRDGMVLPGNTIIQVGDLVHRGPQGDELVAWVAKALGGNRDPDCGTWVQLLGNHEGHHLGGPTFQENTGGGVKEFVQSDQTIRTLQMWLHSGVAHMAAAITHQDGNQTLVTHAGLTWHTWNSLASPADAIECAHLLNQQPPEIAFAPGWLLGGYRQARMGGLQPPGVAWASAAKEVYPSWEGRYGPFDQAHGHSVPYLWKHQKWVVDYSIQARTTLFSESRHTCFETQDGTLLWGLDPGFGPEPPRSPLVAWRAEGVVSW